MNKKLEKKVTIDIPNPEPQIVNAEMYGVTYLLQDHVPYEDWNSICDKCFDEYLYGEFDNLSIIIKKVILDEYTNIDTSIMDGYDIISAFDDLDMDCEFWNSIYDKLYLRIIDEEVYNQTNKALREFFSDTVAKDLVEELKDDLNKFDANKLKELTDLFINTNLKRG